MAVGYVAYIDEAGDDGLKRVYPYHESGSSEWFVVSCVLTRIENDRDIVELVRSVVAKFANSQRKDIHYKDLIPAKKRIVCEAISSAKIRSFVVMSNKKNMQNYVNERIRARPQLYTNDKNWFYWWLVRCLLERVTEECELRAPGRFHDRKLRIIFSRRGGMNYSHFREYLKKLEWQSQTNSMYLSLWDIRWSIIDHNEIHAHDHKSMAGLQLADVVASAFYQAVAETPKRPCEPEFARILHRTVAYKTKTAGSGNKYRRRFDYGVKLLPSLSRAELTPSQKEIFEFYKAPDWLKKR